MRHFPFEISRRREQTIAHTLAALLEVSQGQHDGVQHLEGVHVSVGAPRDANRAAALAHVILQVGFVLRCPSDGRQALVGDLRQARLLRTERFFKIEEFQRRWRQLPEGRWKNLRKILR